MKKPLITILTVLFSAVTVFAQEIKVIEIKEQPLSLKARVAQVKDNNGELCALIEVAAPRLEGLVFDDTKHVGTVKYADGVYSVFVPAGTRSIGFKHSNYMPGTIDFANSGIVVAGGNTYSVGLQRTDIDPAYQYLVLNVKPQSALVEVDGIVQNVSDGTASMLVQVGTTHHYKVSASGRLTEEGDVTVAAIDQKSVLDIELRENAVPVFIQSVPDADIYANERLLGRGQWEGALSPGAYRIEARRDGQVISDEIHNIAMNGNARTDIALKVNYGRLDINANTSNVSITLDGEKVGVTPLMLQQVVPGSHELRASKADFEDALQRVTVTKGETASVRFEMKSAAKPVVEEVQVPEKTEVKAQETKEKKAKDQKPKKQIQPVKYKPMVQTPVQTTKAELVQEPKPEKTPKTKTRDSFAFVGANLGYAPGSGEMSYGAKFGYAKKAGFYVSARSDFNFITADAGEYMSYKEIWQNSDYEASRLNATAGLLFHAFGPVYPYVGAGYGYRNLYAKVATSTGYGLIKDYSFSGIAAEGGVMLKMGPVMLSLGMNTVSFKYGDVELGICVTF